MNARRLSVVPKRATWDYSPPNNLPATYPSLVGRKEEISALAHLLQRADTRLITVTGPPGVGKTRLAIEAARHVLGFFDDGSFFVPLAPLVTPSLVVPRIAQVLEVRERPGQLLVETLQEYLRGQYCLLVLDNFEHLIPATLALPELLAASPGLKLLVTSRTPLRMAGEQLFPLAPLSLPSGKPGEPSTDLEALEHSDAIMLFTQCAALVRPDFRLTRQNAGPIAEICKQLDGLPLAIELAAANVRLLSPSALLPRIGSLLSGGLDDSTAHHRTLRDAIRWSYDTLDASSKTLFRRLGVFRGGCSVEGIEALYYSPDIAHSEQQLTSSLLPRLEKEQLLESVGVLVDQSLLRFTETGAGETRYSMLETIREYARDLLDDSEESKEISRRHALFYVAFAEHIAAQEREERTPEMRHMIESLDAEYDNLQSALSWSADHDIVLALRLAGAIAPAVIWLRASYWAETSEWLEQLIVRSAPLDTTRERAKAGCALGLLTRLRREYERTLTLFGTSLAMYRELGDHRGVAAVLVYAARDLGDLGKLAEARSYLSEALGLYEQLNDKRGVASVLVSLGWMDMAEDRLDSARSFFERSLVLYRELGDQLFIASLLNNLGVLTRTAGDYSAAQVLLEESVALHRAVGDVYGVSSPLLNLGQLALQNHDLHLASLCLMEAFSIKAELGHKLDLAECLASLSGVAREYGELDKSCLLLGAADALIASAGAPMHPLSRIDVERQRDITRRDAGEKRFKRGVSEGKLLSMAQVVALLPPAPVRKSESLENTSAGAAEAKTAAPDITSREVEVLRLVAAGLSDAQVAEKLFLSPRTIHNHLYSIYSKLGVGSRTAAVRLAVDNHLL